MREFPGLDVNEYMTKAVTPAVGRALFIKVAALQ